MIKILVVDDETLARSRIIQLLGENDLAKDICEASSGKEAIESINKLQPDLVFLDIQMTDMNGFSVLKNINHSNIPIIIFVTAYDNFALQAFEFEALDFLLKPYKKERFFAALNRGVSMLKLKKNNVFKTKISNLLSYLNEEEGKLNKTQINYLEKIILKTKNRYYFVKTETIKHITSSAYYAEIFTLDKKKHIYRISIKDFTNKLDPKKFYRINRSTIISLQEIKEIISEGFGDFSIIMNDNKKFNVTRKYKNDFLKIMNIKNNHEK